MGIIYHNGLPYCGGGSGSSAAEKELTYAEYLALTEEEKNNGTTYYITDAKSVNISTILNTKEEIETNTEENKIAGALAVKEIAKYKMANTSGLASNERGLIVLPDFSAHNIGYTGMYYISNGVDLPTGVSTNGYIFAMVFDSTFRQIMYMPYNSGRLYVDKMVNGVWAGWEEYTLNSDAKYTTRDELGIFTADGTYELDFSGYKKLLIYLTASNVYGTYEIIDVDLIISDAFPIISKSLQAGNDTYSARVSYILNKNTIQIIQLISSQANKQVRVYGIK